MHRAVALIGIVKWHSVCKGECLRTPQHRQENDPFLVCVASPVFRLFSGHFVGKKHSQKKNVKRQWVRTSSFTLQERGRMSEIGADRCHFVMQFTVKLANRLLESPWFASLNFPVFGNVRQSRIARVTHHPPSSRTFGQRRGMRPNARSCI